MPDADDDLDLEDSFSTLAIELFSMGSVQATLARIVHLAEFSIEGCDAAGILTVEYGSTVSLASSGPLAEAIGRMQRECGEGPSLDASATGLTHYAHDLLEDTRWPTFAAAAATNPVRCVLAYSLGTRLSSLNLYSRFPNAFGVNDRARGHLFATLAGLALESAGERAAADDYVVNLNEALRTRELIGQAQGILIERERITPDQAFDILRRASQHLNIKLRDVAEALVETGESPDQDPSRSDERPPR